MKLVLIFLMLASSICRADQCKAKEPSCDPRAYLVMDYMYSHFGIADSDLSVWLDNAYSIAGRVRLERREHKFEQMEKWAQTLPDADRRAWLGILQYYEAGAKGAYAEWHTHDKQRVQAEYSRHLIECAEAERKSAAAQPLPKPPENLVHP